MLGLALLITCQALLHIMVTVNLIPETGQTLPLISRGGSSTLWTAQEGVLNHPYDNRRFDHEGERGVPNCIVVRR